jgi:FkbM family methyltransferase
MNWGVRSLARRLLAYTPYRITKSVPNRFDAIEDCLRQLARSRFAPSLIIDAGAHTGAFATMARSAFPAAAIHMIEPQPGCAPGLQKLSAKPGFFFHPVAVTSEAGPVHMCVRSDGDTGAHVTWAENRHEANLVAQGTTLDELFISRCSQGDRILLKLDLQGHEMLALRGAAQLLPKVEVVLLEVSFFQQIGEPAIPEVVRFFDKAGFDLYDVAALSGRSRDGRLRQGDFVFVKRNTQLWTDKTWH